MLTIRPAVLPDAKAMMEVHRQAVFAKLAGHYPRAALEAWAPGATPDRVLQVEREIADPAFIVLVAKAAGDVIGFAVAVPASCARSMSGSTGSAASAAPCWLKLKPRLFALTDRLACDASPNAEAFYRANGYQAESRTRHVLLQGIAISCIRMSKQRPADRAGTVRDRRRACPRKIDWVRTAQVGIPSAHRAPQICQRNQSSRRIVRIAARSKVASTNPGDVSAIAIIRPEGSTAKECPSQRGVG
jgi:hypothetical protein